MIQIRPNMKRRDFIFIFLIFLLGFLIRAVSIYPNNIILGFDQARDFFDAGKILSGDIRIVGPTAGNNASFHHGVAYLYYIIPPIYFFNANPLAIALWNSLVNSLSGVVLFFISLLLFKNKKAAYLSLFLASVSYYFVSYSAWLSNPTVTIFTVPLVFFGFVLYKNKKDWGLILALFFLGLSIQFEIFFLYLFFLIPFVFLILKLKFPSLKIIILSFFSLALSLSTMIATEFKFGFATVKSLLNFSKTGSNDPSYFSEFIKRFVDTFSQTVLPTTQVSGKILIVLILIALTVLFLRKREEKRPIIFLLFYLLSPFILFIFLYHKAPWFLIALPPAIVLTSGYILSKLKLILLIPIILTVSFVNLNQIKNEYNLGQKILEPDKSAILQKQIATIDFIYQNSKDKTFCINTLTNPLYINAVWAYNFKWYGDTRYGFLPCWEGSDQEYPYNTLSKTKGKEEKLFLILDESSRIPPVHKMEIIKWAEKQAKLLNQKDFDGISVLEYKYLKN